jgi:sigma-E factor negative regulatory protein RseB
MQFLKIVKARARGWGCVMLSLVALAGASCVVAQTPAPVAGGAPGVVAQNEAQQAGRGVTDWLMRMHEASRRRAYIGTFVVSSGSNMSSAKIWHVCDGEHQMERVESLSGAPRSTFRHDDQVITFLPGSKQAVAEQRESLGLFPDLLKSTDSSIAQFYAAQPSGQDRVAGFDADVVELQPKDKLRYGYRVWTEKKSGLVVKLQTLDTEGRVLEQSAFSELQLDAPVSMSKLSQMMGNTDGYKVEKPELVKTTAVAQGWVLKNPVAGFKAMSCYKRPAVASEGSTPKNTMQWVFSDGLASISLFVEVFDSHRHLQEGLMTLGATQTFARRVGDWWVTVVGEAPAQTLTAFAQGLERKKTPPN